MDNCAECNAPMLDGHAEDDEICVNCDFVLDEEHVEEKLVDALRALTYGEFTSVDGDLSFLKDANVRTFGEAGAMTYDHGVWIELPGGKRLTLTIKLQ